MIHVRRVAKSKDNNLAGTKTSSTVVEHIFGIKNRSRLARVLFAN